jgi:hypothetical protein
MKKYYKVTGKNGVACNGGNGEWHLPKDGKPGEWMPHIEDINPCVSGYHLCEVDDLIEWLNEETYEAEGRGESIRDTDKTVFQEARLLRKLETWNDKTARLFAADCAERVLQLFEKEFPDDDRPRKAIEAVRKYANGEISKDDLIAARAARAARAAAFAAEAAAATWATWAARAARAARAAAFAAGAAAATWATWAAAAAGAAAAAAAAEAAAAAGAAERKWQTKRLKEYLGI